MSTDRKDNKVTRLDLRIPNDIYTQVEEIARVNNAPSHHITGKIILSPTLLKLISLGIESLSGNYPKLTDISQPSDSLSPRIDAIEGEFLEVKKFLTELAGKLSSMIPDTLSDTLSDTISDTLSDTKIVLPESIDQPPSSSSSTNKTKTDYPDWVKKDDRPFYDVLINNSELLTQVIDILQASPTLAELSTLLFEIGILRKDGKPYGRDRVGRIKYVVKNLNGVEVTNVEN